MAVLMAAAVAALVGLGSLSLPHASAVEGSAFHAPVISAKGVVAQRLVAGQRGRHRRAEPGRQRH